MFRPVTLIAAALLIQGAAAQDTTPADEPLMDEVVDEIIVRGGKINPALAAFEAGDFATAEIEFTKNARCARRVERNRAAALDQLRSNQIGQNVRAGGASSGGGQAAAQSGQTGQGGAPATFQASATRADEADEAEEAVSLSTCGNRGYQVYMAGLSQLQLGKIAEVKDSFAQAVTLNKNLYDAHYRLGLIGLLEGDEKKARKHLGRMRTIGRRCRDCADKGEIDAFAADLAARLR